jgi:propanol-preferring alcohol dehydrogenase
MAPPEEVRRSAEHCEMRALVHHAGARGELALEEREMPRAGSGEIVLRVLACGVCRTDLHVVDEELPPRRESIVPGHQIVGELPGGARAGVMWLGGTDGTCAYCRSDRENLCDAPTFTGYDRDGGYAEYVAARADFTVPIPPQMTTEQAAPLLCAGVIGFRALRVAGVQPRERVGLYGFGASAHLALQVLLAWGCEVYVCTRGASHQSLARELGASWVGEATEVPPLRLDRAVTFAPAGDVVVAALAALRKGGVVAINAIHLDRMPQFDYDRLLWGERQIRSVTNMTRSDARDFLRVAAEIGLRPRVAAFSLEEGTQALQAVREDRIDGAAVLFPEKAGIR